jgi:hypothetical protein
MCAQDTLSCAFNGRQSSNQCAQSPNLISQEAAATADNNRRESGCHRQAQLLRSPRPMQVLQHPQQLLQNAIGEPQQLIEPARSITVAQDLSANNLLSQQHFCKPHLKIVVSAKPRKVRSAGTAVRAVCGSCVHTAGRYSSTGSCFTHFLHQTPATGRLYDTACTPVM